jgi:hypothetical protein
MIPLFFYIYCPKNIIIEDIKQIIIKIDNTFSGHLLLILSKYKIVQPDNTNSPYIRIEATITSRVKLANIASNVKGIKYVKIKIINCSGSTNFDTFFEILSITFAKKTLFEIVTATTFESIMIIGNIKKIITDMFSIFIEKSLTDEKIVTIFGPHSKININIAIIYMYIQPSV